ncbi:MAG: hydroxyisourate hydrolase, partial [Paracoccaceae bacterium]
MSGYLTTHVLDTARGCPAQGILITLYRVSGNSHRKIATAVTNADGRTDAPIL